MDVDAGERTVIKMNILLTKVYRWRSRASAQTVLCQAKQIIPTFPRAWLFRQMTSTVSPVASIECDENWPQENILRPSARCVRVSVSYFLCFQMNYALEVRAAGTTLPFASSLVRWFRMWNVFIDLWFYDSLAECFLRAVLLVAMMAKTTSQPTRASHIVRPAAHGKCPQESEARNRVIYRTKATGERRKRD